MCAGLLVSLMLVVAPGAFAQTATVTGAVRDETGRALPGVSVELRVAGGAAQTAVSDSQGRYRIERVTRGRRA
jgi:protocatechuate 3,4-dioxygenase beta subunit